MSARQSIHPLTEASIGMQGQTRDSTTAVSSWRCGCDRVTTKGWWLCDYHDGFEDGVEATEARCACGRPASETVAGQPCCGDDR